MVGIVGVMVVVHRGEEAEERRQCGHATPEGPKAAHARRCARFIMNAVLDLYTGQHRQKQQQQMANIKVRPTRPYTPYMTYWWMSRFPVNNTPLPSMYLTGPIATPTDRTHGDNNAVPYYPLPTPQDNVRCCCPPPPLKV
jgi:hypothetical protein